jgi:hypothetical protein
MARPFRALALISLVPAALAFAEPECTPSPSPSPAGSPNNWWGKFDRGRGPGGPDRRPSGDGDADGPLARFKKRLEQMSPEERQRFQENWKRWKQMGNGEQRDWQGRAEEERDRMKKVIDDTIQKIGLKLDDDQREVFVLRYRQERRKIEEQLRQEMDAKRATEIDAMLQRLKAEFSAPKPAAASPKPTP